MHDLFGVQLLKTLNKHSPLLKLVRALVIIEESTNFPTVLGRKNIPAVKSWGSGRIIGTLPSVARERQGLFPQFLRQLPPRGTGLRLGTAREGLTRGMGRRLTELERLKRHKAMYGRDLSIQAEEAQMQMNAQYNTQMTNYPILPLLDRPHPVLDAIKASATIVPRTKLLGTFGIIDPTEKNIPTPWGPRTWPTGAEVGRLPSVIQTGAGVSGPTRTMHPEISIVV